jgi:hypothetical protein
MGNRNHNTSTLIFASLASSFYLLQDKGAQDNGGGCGWSEPGMRKYDELYAAIKKDRKKSAPTFNQELLEMFLSRRKNVSGRGSK